LDKDFIMASFTTRVELHGASGEQYELLHAAMERAGFRRWIEGQDASGVTHRFALPTAEYDYEASANAAQVRDLAKRIADGVKFGAWVLVTQGADRAWHTTTIAKVA
jgi:hypothetical protein